MAIWTRPHSYGLAALAALGGACQVGWTQERDPPLASVSAPKGHVLKRDSENYFQGPYVAFASDWSVTTGKVKLRRGVDYADHLIINPRTFPAGTVMKWQWPSATPSSGVYGYLHIAHGYYAGGMPRQPTRPVQVKNVGDVRATVDVAVRADPGTYNLLSETFLTHAPRSFKKRGLEVGFLMNLSADGRSFFNRSTQLGRWTDPAGVSWQVARNADYCMLTPESGTRFKGTLFYGAVLRWLMRRGQLTGAEWFNGVALGVEPVRGRGDMTVRAWRVQGLA